LNRKLQQKEIYLILKMKKN